MQEEGVGDGRRVIVFILGLGRIVDGEPVVLDVVD